MSATAFITGISKGGSRLGLATGLGAVLMGGMRLAGMAKKVENPDSFIPVPGLTIRNTLGFIGAKTAGDKGTQVTNKIAAMIETPGKIMSLPLESFGLEGGRGSFAELAASSSLTQKMLGENAEQTIGKVAIQSSSFGGKIMNGLGNVLQLANDKLGISSTIESKIEKKKQQLASFRKAHENVENKPSAFQALKSKIGKGPTMADNADTATILKGARSTLAQAAFQQAQIDNISPLELVKRQQAVKDLQTELSSQRNEAFKNVKTLEEYKIAEKAFNQTITKEQQAIIDAAQIGKPLQDAKDKLFNTLEHEVKGEVSGKVKSTIREYANNHEDLNELNNKKKFWQNPTQGLKDKAKNLTVGEVADFTLRYGMVAQQGLQSIKSTKIGLRTLKQLIADVTQQDASEISTFKALFGKATPMVKQARSQFFKSMLSQAIPFVGGTIAQEVASRKLGRMYGKDNTAVTIGITAGFGMVQQLSGMLFKDNTMLQTFADLRMGEEAGQELTAQHYALLLESASADIAKMNGRANYNTVLIAQYYALNNTPIAEVMQDINQGKETLMQRSHQGSEAMKQMQQATQMAQEVATQAPQKTDDVVKGKFTSQTRNQPTTKGGYAEMAIANQQQATTNSIA